MSFALVNSVASIVTWANAMLTILQSGWGLQIGSLSSFYGVSLAGMLLDCMNHTLLEKKKKFCFQREFISGTKGNVASEIYS